MYIHNITRIPEIIITLTSIKWDVKLQWIPRHCNIKGNDLVDHQENLWCNPRNNLPNRTKKSDKNKWHQLWTTMEMGDKCIFLKLAEDKYA